MTTLFSPGVDALGDGVLKSMPRRRSAGSSAKLIWPGLRQPGTTQMSEGMKTKRGSRETTVISAPLAEVALQPEGRAEAGEAAPENCDPRRHGCSSPLRSQNRA